MLETCSADESLELVNYQQWMATEIKPASLYVLRIFDPSVQVFEQEFYKRPDIPLNQSSRFC